MSDNKEKKFGVIEGVLAYAKIAQSDFSYNSKIDKEYSILVLVDEDAADAWDEEFSKQSAKKIKAAEFESLYKFENPFKGAKNVYEIKLKKSHIKDGQEINPDYRPKVFLDMKDGTRVDITESRLISNGSLGKVSYRISTNTFGTFAHLNNVLVEEDTFKEYVATGGAGSEFGKKEVVKEAPRKEVTEARKEKKPTKKDVVDSSDIDDDLDLPF